MLSATLLSELLSAVPSALAALSVLPSSVLAALSFAASLCAVFPCEQAVSIAAVTNSASACFFEILRLILMSSIYENAGTPAE